MLNNNYHNNITVINICLMWINISVLYIICNVKDFLLPDYIY